jgi:predicted RNase H-like HicB family nuclease
MLKEEMTMKYSFRIQWSEEDEAFVATSAEFPGLSAFGETHQEALREAETALELMIETYQASGIPLPKPKPQLELTDSFQVSLPVALHHQAAALAQSKGISLHSLVCEAVKERVAAN